MEYKNNELDANNHKNIALNDIDYTIKTHIYEKDYKQAHLLSYWFEDFSKYHREEKTFNVSKSGVYKRGSIIKVNLGYNIGNELGGLHYCVVLTKYDNKNNGTLTVLPLSSKKKNKKYNKILCIDLKNELYELMRENLTKLKEKLEKDFSNLVPIEFYLEVKEQYEHFKQLLEKQEKEIERFNKDSIILINQITTISKQRIYIDKHINGIRLSNTSLDLIDKQITKNFMK